MTPADGSVLRDAVDGLRMAVGTLTVVPVRVPRVDRGVAAWAMALAPLVGVPLGLAAAVVLLAAGAAGLSPYLAATLAVGLLALLTRGLHLDGLADFADGLGSGRPAGEALEIMRRSDIGPFGVLTLVLVLLVQVLALGGLTAVSPVAGAVGAVVAVAAGRLAITWACTPLVPSARRDGLGAFVAGTVPFWAAGAAFAGTAGVALGGLLYGGGFALGCVLGVVAGLIAAAVLLQRAVRRLGGITGDVLGAVAEAAAATALVVAALAA